MSGSLAALAVGAYSLAVDAALGENTVSLGDFVFDGWEVPERIRWGGQQRMSVHKLIGGDRVIDTMGPDHADISWTGIMLSPDASLRADELDQMRIAGQLVPLIFANRYYEVVVSRFQADQRKAWHVPYSITCTVYRDQSFVAAAAQDTPLASVTSDVASGLSFVSNGLAAASTALALVPPLLAPMTAIVAGTAATAAVAGDLAATSTAITAASVIANASIATLTTTTIATGALAGQTAVLPAIAAMQTAAQATQDAATAAAMAGYVNRSISTVNNA